MFFMLTGGEICNTGPKTLAGRCYWQILLFVSINFNRMIGQSVKTRNRALHSFFAELFIFLQQNGG